MEKKAQITNNKSCRFFHEMEENTIALVTGSASVFSGRMTFTQNDTVKYAGTYIENYLSRFEGGYRRASTTTSQREGVHRKNMHPSQQPFSGNECIPIICIHPKRPLIKHSRKRRIN